MQSFTEDLTTVMHFNSYVYKGCRIYYEHGQWRVWSAYYPSKELAEAYVDKVIDNLNKSVR